MGRQALRRTVRLTSVGVVLVLTAVSAVVALQRNSFGTPTEELPALAATIVPGVYSEQLRQDCGYEDAGIPLVDVSADLVAMMDIGDGSTKEKVYTCMMETLEDSAETSPERSLAQLYDLALYDRSFAAAFCHLTAHGIGKRVQARYGPEGALRYAPTFCVGGYMHGVLEYAGDRKDDAVALLEQCRSVVPDGSYYLDYECLHGYGHLIAMGKVSTLRDLMESCVPHVRNEQEFEGCASGVTGALTARLVGDFSHTSEPLGEAFYEREGLRNTCTDLASPYTRGCWRTVAMFWHHAGIDRAELDALCMVSGLTVCGLGIGQTMSFGGFGDIHERAVAHCSTFGAQRPGDVRDQQWAACLAGTVMPIYQRLESAGWTGWLCDGFPAEHRDGCRELERHTREIDASLEEVQSFSEMRPIIALIAAGQRSVPKNT